MCHVTKYSKICLLLRPFDFSRKAEAGELEARETGNEHARDHETPAIIRSICSSKLTLEYCIIVRHCTFRHFENKISQTSLAFSPSLGPLRALLFLKKKRDGWERGSFKIRGVFRGLLAGGITVCAGRKETGR